MQLLFIVRVSGAIGPFTLARGVDPMAFFFAPYEVPTWR